MERGFLYITGDAGLHDAPYNIPGGKTMGLFILVAIPLPGTGAWTGALVAAFLDIRLRRAFPAIALGVFVAGILVSAISYSAFWAFGA